MQPPTPRMGGSTAAVRHQLSVQSLSEDTLLRARKHFCYALHLPIAQQDDSGGGGGGGQHECNQRMVLLYGFGRARDQVKHTVKKVSKVGACASMAMVGASRPAIGCFSSRRLLTVCSSISG